LSGHQSMYYCTSLRTYCSSFQAYVVPVSGNRYLQNTRHVIGFIYYILTGGAGKSTQLFTCLTQAQLSSLRVR
jgi:hypothetical protein